MSKLSSRKHLLWGIVALAVAVLTFAVAYLLGLSTSAPLAVSDSPELEQSDSAQSSSAEKDMPTSGAQSSQDESTNEALSDPDDPQGESAAPDFPDLSRRIADDPTALGNADAPVVLIEYADYRCPFCGVFAREIQPKLVEEYVDKGLVRIEWRDTPIFGLESFDAAVAARAAGQQGMFWEYYDALFAYDGSGHQSLPRERLLQIAQEIGVPDMDAFASDLDSDELSAAVGADYAESQSIGVYSTPAFLVGTTPILGAQAHDVFREAIEEELNKAGVGR